MRRLSTIVVLASLLVAAFAGAASAARGGHPGSPVAPDAIWADGDLHGTVPQGSLPYNGRDSSYDQLVLVPGQAPVSEAAPGNRDYNGGRWLPVPAEWVGRSQPLLTSYADVLQAVDDGLLVLGEPDRSNTFLCPLVR